VLGLSRSTYYDYQRRQIRAGVARAASIQSSRRPRNPAQDQAVVEYILELRSQEFFDRDGGYRRLTDYVLRDLHIRVNPKRMYRICKENRILLPRFRKSKGQRKLCQNRKLTAPNQLWQFDIKHGWIAGINRPFYLCSFLDVFSKDVVGYHIGLSCKAHDIARALRCTLEKYSISAQTNLWIRSDNGTQMTADTFAQSLTKLPVKHEFTPVKCPDKNAFIEAFHSILETKCLDGRSFASYAEAYACIHRFITYYNNHRIHASIRMEPARLRQLSQDNKINNPERYLVAC
jgi:putative transposase